MRIAVPKYSSLFLLQQGDLDYRNTDSKQTSCPNSIKHNENHIACVRLSANSDICSHKLTIIGSDNGSSPGRRQAII